MYGLLYQAMSDRIKTKYGEDKWEEVRKLANLDHTFATHETYSEEFVVRIAEAAARVVGESQDAIMDDFGVHFVSYVGKFGYDKILMVLGRHMRDFLNGLDNLHEYLRFSYPKMKPPSFFVENEGKGGLTLHYRSRRKGFLHYVKGQIRQVGEMFYNTKVNIYVVDQKENSEDGTVHVKFRLLFDNMAFRDANRNTADSIVDNIPLSSELLFELFPFHLVVGRQMEIRSVGTALAAVIPDCIGRQITDVFYLARPLTRLIWEEVLAHTNNVFELVSIRLVRNGLRTDDENSEQGWNDRLEDMDEFSKRLHVKGQMMFMSEWESIMFLGTPIMKSLDDMFNSGLYINDLSMHDSSRDLVLAGTQQSAELKLALDQEQGKSRLLEESMRKLDLEMKRTDALLYQMIPKSVADRLRRGEPSVATCQAFDSVTILFSDVVGFTTICSRITPMEVVSMLNAMYTEFDQLSETHDVYKVETIGDAYMAVAGAPTMTKYHALSMCNMALDMLQAMTHLKDPSTQDNMKIRVGIHTGATVAGVVGIKMPRYCLFGDTVNTASRMETSGEVMKIHISETTREKLHDYPYKLEERGEIEVKGKGSMKTYWLLGRDEDPAKVPRCPFTQLMEENHRQSKDQSSLLDEVSTRPVYSPVSFQDISTDQTQKFSPGNTPQSSPAHRAAAAGEGKGAPVSSPYKQNPGESQGRTHPHQGPGPGPGAQSLVSSHQGTVTKPTQAVPPTRSGSCSPAFGESHPLVEVTAVDDKQEQVINNMHYHQGNGVQQQPLHLQHVHSNQHGNSVLVNNNDKSRQTYSIPMSDVQEPCSPLNNHVSDSGRGSLAGTGSNHSASKINSGVIKLPSQGQGHTISDEQQKDFRTEKSKSKTCSLL